MLKFESVVKSFPDGTTGIDDLSFHITPGEFVFLTGPSGSGKTTIMRLLTKEYLPSDGEIIFKDYPLSALKRSLIPAHRRQMGVVFQDYQLLSDLKAWENIALSLEIAGLSQKEIAERVNELLALVKLENKAFLFPKQLSGGEAQRVGIARALASGPSLIFADEPTGNLDSESSLNIVRLLKKINELGTTVIIATHDTNLLDAFKDDRLITVIKGKLESDSKPPKSAKKPSKNLSDDKSEAGEDKSKETEPEEETEKPEKDEPQEKAEKKSGKSSKFGFNIFSKKDKLKDKEGEKPSINSKKDFEAGKEKEKPTKSEPKSKSKKVKVEVEDIKNNE